MNLNLAAKRGLALATMAGIAIFEAACGPEYTPAPNFNTGKVVGKSYVPGYDQLTVVPTVVGTICYPSGGCFPNIIDEPVEEHIDAVYDITFENCHVPGFGNKCYDQTVQVDQATYDTTPVGATFTAS